MNMENENNTWEIITVSDVIGKDFEDDFENFDLTEVQKLVSELQNQDVPDLAHAEFLQLKSLRAADLLTEYLGKIVKLTAYYEAKANKVKYQVALNYKGDGGKITQEARKWAGESSDELMDVETKLAKIKGTKALLEKKFEIVIRMYHGNKDIASGMRKSIPMNNF